MNFTCIVAVADGVTLHIAHNTARITSVAGTGNGDVTTIVTVLHQTAVLVAIAHDTTIKHTICTTRGNNFSCVITIDHTGDTGIGTCGIRLIGRTHIRDDTTHIITTFHCYVITIVIAIADGGSSHIAHNTAMVITAAIDITIVVAMVNQIVAGVHSITRDRPTRNTAIIVSGGMNIAVVLAVGKGVVSRGFTQLTGNTACLAKVVT